MKSLSQKEKQQAFLKEYIDGFVKVLCQLRLILVGCEKVADL